MAFNSSLLKMLLHNDDVTNSNNDDVELFVAVVIEKKTKQKRGRSSHRCGPSIPCENLQQKVTIKTLFKEKMLWIYQIIALI